MTTFSAGDWVHITPNSDYSWHYWDEMHDRILGKKGRVVDIQPDANDENLVYYLVRTYFDDGSIEYETWFLGRHIIKDDKGVFDREEHMKKICDELQEWEQKKRKLLDDQLRHVFGPKPKEKAPLPRRKSVRKRVNLFSKDANDLKEINDPDYTYDENSYYDNEDYWEPWEEDTQEVDLDQIAFGSIEDIDWGD